LTAPDALFELAVNRAATTLLGLGLSTRDAGQGRAWTALGKWHARTRFARRVPLLVVVDCLNRRPTEGEWFWQGGSEGDWKPGRAAFP